MENVTKIKLKSAKHKIGVGYREGEKKKPQQFATIYKTMKKCWMIN